MAGRLNATVASAAPAVEVSEGYRIEVRNALPEAVPTATEYSGLAVLQAGRWVAICRELGLVAEGASADRALDALEETVQEAIVVADAEGLERGREVPEEEIRQLLLEHTGVAPVTLRNFTA